MNKKGFTLVEIIGVIVVLSLLLIVAVPSLTKTLKRNEQNKYNDYIDNLRIAAENYVVSKLQEGETINESIDVTLGDLIDYGYVKEVVANPENNNVLSRNTIVKVTREADNTFKYQVYEHYLLPDKYQQVDYIQSSGTQYLEIDFFANQDTITKAKYQIIEKTAKMLFGSRVSVSNSFYGFNWTSSSYYNSYYRGDLTSTGIDTEPHILYKNKGEMHVDGKHIHTINSSVEFTTPHKMIVFGCNTNGTIGLFSSARIFNLSFYENDILKVDLVPCYRKSDGEPGMYDLKQGKFYTNSGTGDFVVGNDI